jgi:DNA modification methylase
MTSPPYWRQRVYDSHSGLGTEPTFQEYVSRLVRIFHELKRVLKQDGSLWLNLGDAYLNKNLLGMPWRVALALHDGGWILRNAVVWDKVKGNPDNAKDKLRNMYEFVFHLVQSDEYYYDADAIRQPPGQPYRKDGRIVTPTGVSGRKYEQQIISSGALSAEEKANALRALREALTKVENGLMPDFRMIIRGEQRSTHSDSPEFSGRADELRKRGYCILPYHPRGAKPGDVWRIIPEDECRKDTHYAVFPTDLCRIPILATCPEKGIVLDPFAGTGTTIVAALALGRRGVGIDTSALYLKEAKTRIEGYWADTKFERAQGRLFQNA